MKYTRIISLLISCLMLATLQANAQTVEQEEQTQFTIYGFGRTTFVWDDQDLGRSDLFVPANIKVDETKNPNFFIGAKQTRIGFDVKHTLGGEMLSIKLEGDFTMMNQMPMVYSGCAMRMQITDLFSWE